MEIKKFLLYSIVPALVAGLFSVAPIIYERTTAPKASLTFKLIDGPQIAVNNEQQQVISVALKNSGSKPLNMVKLSISTPGGTIQTFSESSPSGLPLDTKNNGTSIVTATPRMLERESFSITLLIKSPKNSLNMAPSINARSDETLGSYEEVADKTGSRTIAASLGAGLAAISVFFMSVFFQVKSRLIGGGTAREDMIFYIAIATNTEHLLEKSPDEITYMRFAELLLKFGCSDKEGGDTNRKKSIKALKCLLLLDKRPSSDEIIKRNLKLLEKSDNVELAKKLKATGNPISDGVALRDLIDKLLASSFQLP